MTEVIRKHKLGYRDYNFNYIYDVYQSRNEKTILASRVEMNNIIDFLNSYENSWFTIPEELKLNESVDFVFYSEDSCEFQIKPIKVSVTGRQSSTMGMALLNFQINCDTTKLILRVKPHLNSENVKRKCFEIHYSKFESGGNEYNIAPLMSTRLKKLVTQF